MQMNVVFTINTFQNLYIQHIAGLAQIRSLKIDGSIAQLTKYTVESGHRNQFILALSAYVSQALEAEGNIMVEAYAEIEHPSVLWLIERWENQQALAALQASTQANDIDTLTIEGLTTPVGKFSVTDLEPLSKEAWRKQPNANDDPMMVMLFFDTKPETQDEFKKRYHAAMPDIRGEAGMVTYQLTQLDGTDTKFLTYEKFRVVIRQVLMTSTIQQGDLVLRCLTFQTLTPPTGSCKNTTMPALPK